MWKAGTATTQARIKRRIETKEALRTTLVAHEEGSYFVPETASQYRGYTPRPNKNSQDEYSPLGASGRAGFQPTAVDASEVYNQMRR